ncbi:hypothetical protein [Nocardia sp. NPDC052112]|uniref:hypothetical protein n=1 Tax=Nocardia sp. NPDC052112 TaxID=3155646 RepID=UPI003444AC91
MTSHSTISPQEAADRLAIRELIDAYAHCADRRDAKGQSALRPAPLSEQRRIVLARLSGTISPSVARLTEVLCAMAVETTGCPIS